MRLAQSVTGGATVRMAYDGLDRIAEYDAANALQRRYVHGPGDDEPIVWYEGTGTTDRRFLGSDERGSIISVSDSAGAVLGLNRYDEYGQPQATNLGTFGYTGQAWLPGANLWHYKARAYDPELGRFLQTDPIGYAGGVNLYAYVGNDPVNLVDPLGLKGFYACTGSRLCKQNESIGVGFSGFSSSLGGGGPGGARAGRVGVCTNCGQPAVAGANGDIVVTAPTYVYVNFYDVFWTTGRGGRLAPVNPVVQPSQTTQVCPSPQSLPGRVRHAAGSASDWLGAAAAGSALAGAVPTPATPVLEGAALALAAASGLFRTVQIAASASYWQQSGQSTALKSDLVTAGVGAVPVGRGFASAATRAGSVEKNAIHRVADASHAANVNANFPTWCN